LVLVQYVGKDNNSNFLLTKLNMTGILMSGTHCLKFSWRRI